MNRGSVVTPLSIQCPSCRAPAGTVCLTYVEPDVAYDLACRVALYCAERIDAAFVAFAQSLQGKDPR
jgi:hypothetical protein